MITVRLVGLVGTCSEHIEELMITVRLVGLVESTYLLTAARVQLTNSKSGSTNPNKKIPQNRDHHPEIIEKALT